MLKSVYFIDADWNRKSGTVEFEPIMQNYQQISLCNLPRIVSILPGHRINNGNIDNSENRPTINYGLKFGNM